MKGDDSGSRARIVRALTKPRIGVIHESKYFRFSGQSPERTFSPGPVVRLL